MITAFFMSVLGNVLTTMIGLFPNWSEPTWVASAASTFRGILANIGSYDYIIPLGTIGVCLLAIMAAWVAATVIRLLRISVSLVTGGGGTGE